MKLPPPANRHRLREARWASGRLASGFTLLEILVATAILGLISVLLVQVLNGVRTGSSTSEKKVGSAGQAQIIFDILSRDLEAMPVRADIPSLMQNGAANTVNLNFISLIQSPARTGTAGGRNLSTIAYQVAPDSRTYSLNSGKLVLQRAALGQAWATTGLWGMKGALTGTTFTPCTTADWPSTATASTTDYDIIGEGVIRMGLTWQLRTAAGANPRGSVLAAPPVDAAGNPDLSKVGAVTVVLVMVDLPTRILASSTTLTTLAGKFTTPVDNKSLYAQWLAIADSIPSDASLSAIPLPVKQGVRVFQRTFLLNSPL